MIQMIRKLTGKQLKQVGCCILGIVLTLAIALPGQAKSIPQLFPSVEGRAELDLGAPQPPSPSSLPELSNRTELEAFVDNFFAQEVAAKSAPGGAVAIVKDGEIIFSKGYGYADLAQQTPVNADLTRFRVASISKLFTTTATLQLAEQGLIKLDDPIAPYLGDVVQLENPYPEPVTFAQLLTHTDGTTKRRIGLAARTEAQLQSLEDYLADHLPPIVYPPGQLFSYSSHSMALLGYLVQRISGQPFGDYIADHIFEPLEMSHSSFAQPPPAMENLATGYQQRGDRFEPVDYLYLNIGPAAAMSSTVTDLAHFMIAHLQGGRYRNSRILQPESISEMHDIQFRAHPALPGTGYGFRERYINGLQTIGHLGSLRGYSSSLTLIPEENVGIIVVSNSLAGVHSPLLRQFFDRYFPISANPAPDAERPTLDPSNIDLERFAGTYRDLEYPLHTIAKLSAPFEHIYIRPTETGLEIRSPSLFFRDPPAPQPLEPVAPLLFRQPETGVLTAFSTNDDGTIQYAYNPVLATMGTWAKIAWYENLWLHLGILASAAIAFISAVWVWPVHPGIRWLRTGLFKVTLPTPLAWQLVSFTSAVNLVFLFGLPFCLWLYGGWKLAYGMPWFGSMFLVLPIVSTLLTLGMTGLALWSWRQPTWSVAAKGYYSLLTVITILFVALLIYWNILGFQY